MQQEALFSHLAKWTARQCGRAYTFIVAIGVIVVWAATGPLFSYSDTWQLIINTGTTIVTFLMVFLIQNTQNRDTQALQLKLDELIRVNRKARDDMLNLEDLSEEELEKIQRKFADLAEQRATATGEDEKDAEKIGEHAAKIVSETLDATGIAPHRRHRRGS